MKHLTTIVVVLLSFSTEFIANACTCINPDVNNIARVVFGEARGEIYRGQLAVAYTIINRAKHSGYPNSISQVLAATYGGGHHEYNTLDEASHDRQWASARSMNTAEYKSAIKAAKEAFCGCAPDPTSCATNYCRGVNCSAVQSNRYWNATNIQQIGHHTFACMTQVVG